MADTIPGTEIEQFNPDDSAFPALFMQQGEGSLAEVIKDNFGEEGFSVTDLERITVPAGGGRAWDIPDEPPAQTIDGVIVHKQTTRAFWFKDRGEDGEDDSPPDCYSPEGREGHGAFGKGSQANPDGLCKGCPMNEFGSSTRGSGAGKACKEQMQVFLLQEEGLLPVQVSLPPTSLKPFKKYMTRLASKGKSFMAVISSFGLEQQKGGGQTYSVVVPARIGDLDRTEVRAAREYGNVWRGFLEKAAAERAAQERQPTADPEPDAAGGSGDVWTSEEPPN